MIRESPRNLPAPSALILCAGWLLLLSALAGDSLAQGQVTGWARSRLLQAKSQRGETLTPEEQAYLDHAKQEYQKGKGPHSRGPKGGEQQAPPKPEGKPVVSATFESGTDNPPFTEETLLNGAISTVSDKLAHSGKCAGYYYYVGKPPGTSTRAYPDLYVGSMLRRGLNHFLFEMWVYVPSQVNGIPVQLTDWASFATFESSGDKLPFTVDSNPARQIQLSVSRAMPRVFHQNVQPRPVTWSFDKWFKITVEANLKTEKDSRIIIWQDDAKIIDYTGIFFPEGKGFTFGHFGLYMGALQGTYAVYNDDISIWELP